MRRSGSLVSAALAAALAAAPAPAHEADDRALGTVASATARRIVVRTEDGHEVPFAVTAGTRFTRGDEPARAGDVRVGERVVVHGKRANGQVEALRVRLPAAPGRQAGPGRPPR